MHRRNTSGGKDATPLATPHATPPHPVPRKFYKVCAILALVIVSVLVILASQTIDGERGEGDVIEQALLLVHHGNLLQLRQLIERHPHIDWQGLQRKLKTRSFMYTALLGRHSTIHSNRIVGDHEVIK